MDNYPLRNMNHGACEGDTHFPGDPDETNPDGSPKYQDTYMTKKLIIVASLINIGTYVYNTLLRMIATRHIYNIDR
jgi:hypothetical protein